MLEEFLERIVKESGLSKKEVLARVEAKVRELNGLVTREGAAYLVAKQLGINLPAKKRQLEIANIMPGVRNVSFTGRVFRISKISEFMRGTTKGRVVNLFIGDSSGFVKLPLWNEQVDWVDSGKIGVGSVVQIQNAVAKEGMYGDVEITLGNFGSLSVLDDTDLPDADELNRKFSFLTYERAKLRDVGLGNFEIVAFVVKVFNSTYLFDEEGSKKLVIPTIVDDGTGNIRVAFFRNLAEELIGLSAKDFERIADKLAYLEQKLLGRELVIRGRIRKNPRFGRLELIANEARDLSLIDEIKLLLRELREF